MARRERLLLAVLPPGSVEAAVGRVQEAIFRGHGLVSAVALPPLVPVAFLGGGGGGDEGNPLPQGFLGRIERSARAPYRFTATGIAWESGALFLALESAGLWDALRAACAPETGGPGLFPVFEGFFLGCVEAARAERESIRIEPPDVRFSCARLAVARISTAAPGRTWWRDICCAIEEEKPLRGRRA